MDMCKIYLVYIKYAWDYTYVICNKSVLKFINRVLTLNFFRLLQVLPY